MLLTLCFFNRLSLIFIFLSAFIISTSLPDGLFTAKELGLYLTATWCGSTSSIYLLRRGSVANFSILDLLVIALLLLSPMVQYGFSNAVTFPFALQQLAYGIVYFSVRISFSNLPMPMSVNAVSECIGVVVILHFTLAIAQHTGLMPVHYFGAKATGMFFNPGPFGIYTAALVLFSYVLLRINLRSKRWGYVIIQSVASVLGTWLVLTSLSRSAWLGLVVGLILISLWFAIQDGSFASIHKKRWFRFTTLASLVVMAFAGWKTYTFKQDSANGRLLIWNTSALMIQDNWMTGVGVGNFAPQYIHYQAAYFDRNGNDNQLAQLAGDSRYAFNDLLQVAAEYGIIGTLLIISILTLVYSRLFVRIKPVTNASLLMRGGGLAFVVATVLAGLSAYPMQMVPIVLAFWTGVAMIASSKLFNPIMTVSRQVPKAVVASLLFVLSILFVGYGYKRTIAYYHWKQTEHLPVVEKHEKLLPYYITLRDNGEYLRTLGESLAAVKHRQQALRYLQEAIRRSPSPSIYYALADCYASLGNYTDAMRTVGVIKRGIPNLFRPRYLEAIYSYQQGDFCNFKILAERALTFEPKIENVEVLQMKRELRRMLGSLDIQ